MSTATFWVVILVVAVGTLLLRSLPIWLYGRAETPHWLERLLRHVPAAALTALVVPGSLWIKTNGSYDMSPERIIAIVIAAFVAWRWRNMLLTVVVGMVALWAVQAVL